MNKGPWFVVLGVLLLSLLIVVVAVAGPPTTPTLDGTIAANGVDWDADELVVDDATNDSAWANNELDNLYATWDEDNLYVGISYTIESYALIVYGHTGAGGGETNFNSGNGWTGAYPRNITFPATNDINLMLARWSHDDPQVYTVVDNASTEVTSSIAEGHSDNMVEIGIPWSVIGRPYSDTLCLAAVIAGGDNGGAADSMPNNASTDGDGGPDNIDTSLCVDYAPYQADLVINELDADQVGTDAAEFIELYDGGHGYTRLDGLVLVFYNGSNDLSYRAIDLDSRHTDADGYFLAGNAGVAGVDVTFPGDGLQNGQDAVALFWGDAADFPTNTPVTTAGLVDALVYDTSDADDPQLLVLLNSGQPQIDENSRGQSVSDSNQRCPNGSGGQLNTNTYFQRTPTPGADNNCVDLTVSKTGPILARPSTVITYTVSYGNAGVSGATNVVIMDTLPTGVSYVSDDSGLPCPACVPGATGVLTWSAGAVAAGGSDSFSLVTGVGGSVAYGAVLTNTASITSTASEVVTTNNEDEWTSDVSAMDLRVTKEGPAVNMIGEPIVYTITLNNVGVAVATNVILTDTLPLSTTYAADNAEVSPTTPTPGVYAWSFGNVPAASAVTFNLTVTHASGITQTAVFTNNVRASTTTIGDAPANNQDSWVTSIYPTATIQAIQQVADPATNDVSPYANQWVWVEGVVTAGTDEIGPNNEQFVIEHPAGGPWSGLVVFNRGAFPDVQEGDYVQALGQVQEYFGMTELSIRYAPHDLRVLSHGNPLPAPALIATGAFPNARAAEPWESVLIRFEGAAVTDENVGYGEWTLDDGSGVATADDWGEMDGDMTYLAALGDYYCFIQGIGWYTFDVYALEPRYNADISVCTVEVAAAKVSSNPDGQVWPGELVTYTITLTNTGDVDATTTVTDSLAGYFTVSNALDFSQPSTGTLTWTGVVSAGQHVQLQFVAQVIGSLAGLPLGVTDLANSILVNNGFDAPFYVPDLVPPWVNKYGVFLPLVTRTR